MRVLPKLIRYKPNGKLYRLGWYQRNQVLQRFEGMNIYLKECVRWKSWLPGIYLDTGDVLGPFDVLHGDDFEIVGRLG
jgi:hypothetical protein